VVSRYLIPLCVFSSVKNLRNNVMGPRHKTKSGEVPTPAKVWTAGVDANRFDQKETEKSDAFKAEGEKREQMIKDVEAKQAALEKEFAELEAKSKEIGAKAEVETKERIAPLNTKYDDLKAQYKVAQDQRKADLQTLADKVAAKQAEPQSLIDAVKANDTQTDTEKDELKSIKTDIDGILSNPPKEVKEAQLKANKIADEIQHSKKELDYLTSGNRSEKKASLLKKAEAANTALLAATDGKDALKQAKAVVSNTEKAEKTDTQSYPRAASIIWQTYRSLITVIIGFLIAAAIAIPVGIMCGLNRIVMACLTPIISIFRPVSPVVWLLIFQIVVGAFFPDPEKHPLFVFLNSSANPLSYFQTNPAMIFSACTVAMCALWPALVNTALGVSSIDPDHLNVAKVLRLGFWQRLFKIIIPSSLPLVFAGLRISLGVGWMVLIAAEALSSSDGLGKFVWDEYQNGSSQSFANIILACFVVGIIGFILDRVMIVLQRFVSFDESASV